MKKSPPKRSMPIMSTMVSLAIAMLSAVEAAADWPESGIRNQTSDLTDLSLEALMEIKVSSASKRPQKLANVSAAAFVITQDDIRRSGATTIPDLLRMVPGVQVARIDANKWAVSIRGFNGRFANKLLVLKDGRSIYTPLFSGVFWEHQDMLLEDIEQIEVLRGPGAAIWGSNAVNGVINIITKHASDTQGGKITAGGGKTEQGFGSLQYGFGVGSQTDMRVYGNYANRGSGLDSNGSRTHDAWQTGSGGFRLDSNLSGQDLLTVQGDFFAGSYDETFNLYNLETPGIPQVLPTDSSANGSNLLGRWQRTISDTDSIALQLYYDHYKRNMEVVGEKRDTVDLDLQHRFQLGIHQNIIWGLGYRYSHDRLSNTPYIIFSDSSMGASLFSGFIHDEISLVPDRLALILGTRLEHNDYSGFEAQPNVRLLWTPDGYQTVWASVSRAVRTPSRGDDNINYRFMTVPGPARMEINGSHSLQSETVLSYELGYRAAPMTSLNVDTALFYNQYDRLRVPLADTPYLEPTNLVQPYILTNNMHGHTYGAELSVSWMPYDWWRLQASYSYICASMRLDSGTGEMLAEINRADAAAGMPKHQGSVRSSFDIGKQWALDLWVRAVDRVKFIDYASIPGYVTMDARIAWKPCRQLELSVVGQNLFRRNHPEYIPEFINTSASEVPRTIYGKATWKF